MKTIKCAKCGCEMSAMSEACPMCGTPTNQSDTEAVLETSTGNKVSDKTENTPTANELEKWVTDNHALDEIAKDELDYNVLAELYTYQSKVFPNHFIGSREVAELLSLSSLSFDDLWDYWNTLIELGWGVWPISAVLPNKEKEVKSLVKEYNAIASKGKYADSQLSFRTDNGVVFLNVLENGLKKKGLFASDYNKLNVLYHRILSYCDSVILPPQYNK